MSTCISHHGEYSSHQLTASGADRFVCQRCFVLDEDGIMAALESAEAQLASLRDAVEAALRALGMDARSSVRVTAAREILNGNDLVGQNLETDDYHCRCGHLRSVHRLDEPMPCKKKCACVGFESPLPGDPRCEHGQQRAHEYTMLGRLPKIWCPGPAASEPARCPHNETKPHALWSRRGKWVGRCPGPAASGTPEATKPVE